MRAMDKGSRKKCGLKCVKIRSIFRCHQGVTEMDITSDRTVDARDLACPMPIIKTKQALDGMKAGQVLKMIATDPGSVNDMKAWTAKTGHELIGHEASGDQYVFYIRKTK
jgi:tRNA 2-thiouridine synthesizing protein A